jgi:hypothetical protein
MTTVDVLPPASGTAIRESLPAQYTFVASGDPSRLDEARHEKSLLASQFGFVTSHAIQRRHAQEVSAWALGANEPVQ